MISSLSNLLLLLFFFFFPYHGNAHGPLIFDVRSYGAVADGKTDATQSFQRTWAAACGSKAAATMSVGGGRFLIGNVEFRGPCRSRVTVKTDATLVAPAELGNSGNWISFKDVEGISLVGGTFDGQGQSYWNCRSSGNTCAPGARSITLNSVTDAVIDGLTSINSRLMHISVNKCNNVTMTGLSIVAPSQSPNTDGIHLQASTGILILSSNIQTGDDCISVGPGTRNLWIENVHCGPGHGISVGSLGWKTEEDGVENVTVKNAVLTGTQNGLRIKTWARPSNGFARGILFQGIIMNNVKNPILINQNYCPDSSANCPHQSSGIQISGITYYNITGTSATATAIAFSCSQTQRCTGISLRDIDLTHTADSDAACVSANADGTTDGVVVPGGCF